MSNDKFRVHAISGNTMRRARQRADGPNDRMQLLKYAIFYLMIAAILIVTNQAAKNSIAVRSEVRSPSNVHIDLSVARKLEPNRPGGDAAEARTYLVRFRLTNEGDQPIFYPISPNTSRPIGHLLYRIAPGSDWRLLSEPELSTSGPAHLNANGNTVWVEMPPGGWADGEYEDSGSPVGEHSYELDLKFATGGKVSPLLSSPYLVNAN